MIFKKNKWAITNKKSFAVLFLVLILVLITNVVHNPTINVLRWDVFGYYIYLPAFFIYNDLGLDNLHWVKEINSIYHNTATLYQIALSPIGHNVNQYSLGMAILYSPFFLLGHGFALLTNYPADGFSLPYQVSIFLSGILYMLIGLIYFRKVLLHFFSDKIAAIVILIICLGTNYLHLQIRGNAIITHNYLFALYAILIWSTIKWHQQINNKNTLILGLIVGLIVTVRPSEVVSILIPVLYGVTSVSSFKERISFLIKKKKYVLRAVFVAFLVGLPQLIYWKLYAGQFFYYSYNNNGEGLDLLSPHTIGVLFSFRKGWLIYTPIMGFSIIGFYYLYKTHRQLFVPTLLFFIANLYLVSSWSTWWYAGSFSQRALMQSYVVMGLPLGALLSYPWNKSLKISGTFILSFFLIFNLFQTWQISNGILNEERMTKDYYFSVFGQITPPTEEQKELLLIQRSLTAVDEFLHPEKYQLVLTEEEGFENEKEGVIFDYPHSGKRVFKMDKTHVFSPAIKKKFSELTEQDHAWIKVTLWVYPSEKWKESELSLITTFLYKGRAYKYRGMDTERDTELIPNQWNKVEKYYLTPHPRTKEDVFRVDAWLRGTEEIIIDDLKIEVFNKKE
ncbi:MAG: hypothetical protein J5I47_04475 [Vicingus serpentipes]|nr:hypothetical protein [Vicingus serpentipes]